MLARQPRRIFGSCEENRISRSKPDSAAHRRPSSWDSNAAVHGGGGKNQYGISLLLRGLEHWLEGSGLTQIQAAKALGVTQARVSDIKRPQQKRSSPSPCAADRPCR